MTSKATPPRRAPRSGALAGTLLSAAAEPESVVDITTDQPRRPDPEVPERGAPAHVYREVQAGDPRRLRQNGGGRERRPAAP